MQAYISDVGKIAITAVTHNVARHENEGYVLATICKLQTLSYENVGH